MPPKPTNTKQSNAPPPSKSSSLSPSSSTASENAAPTPKPQIISAAVKAAAAASKEDGGGGVGVGEAGGGGAGSASTTNKQPPKKKKAVVKAKRTGSGGNISGAVVVIGKDDTLHPSSKLGVTKNKSIVPKSNAISSSSLAPATALDSVRFSSQSVPPKRKSGSSAASGPGGCNSTVSSGSGSGGKVSASPGSQIQQFKLDRGQIAKRELAEMDAIERAFRDEADVWAGPMNMVFPRRYHAVGNDKQHEDSKGNVEDGGERKKKGEAENHDRRRIAINNPYMSFYGSQSQGWMYGEGFAGIGGRSWTEVTSSAVAASSLSPSADNMHNKGGDFNAITPQLIEDATETAMTTNANAQSATFLMDDVGIVDNALRANGLGRHDVTQTAYACLLEQARRRTLELLADAQDYAIHAQRNALPALVPADLLLAVEMGADGGGEHGAAAALPSLEQIVDLASEVNRVPLPPVPVNCYNGVALPPAGEQLTARTYDVVNGARAAQRMMRGGDPPLTLIGSSGSSSGGSSLLAKKGKGSSGSAGPSHPRKKRVGSYGAGKGRQIAVHIKSKSPGSSSSDGVSGGAMAAAAKAAMGGTASVGGKSSASPKSGSKGQKRKLTEL